MAEKNLVLLRVERLKEEKAFHIIKETVAGTGLKSQRGTKMTQLKTI
jgi:hypothetical protein